MQCNNLPNISSTLVPSHELFDRCKFFPGGGLLPIEDTFKIIYVERIKKSLDSVFPFYLSLHADI